MPGSKPWCTLEAFGVETEYMIVDQDTLEIRSIADKLLTDKNGRVRNDIEHGEIDWSNELAKHLIELKLAKPIPKIQGIFEKFSENINKINRMLNNYGAMLLPTGMHPFLVPNKNVPLWPYDQNEIYDTYDKIFNCSGHGWINVQSTHLNISFCGEQDFIKLHGITRFILPLIPGLAASTPIYEGKYSGYKDSRLTFYGQNQEKVPEISGDIIPEIITGINDYSENILNKMYKAISPFDPEEILQEEWLNSRGAIARFDRSAIEIRIIDCQECPLAEEVVLLSISRLIEYLFSLENDLTKSICEFPGEKLIDLYNLCLKYGEKTLISDSETLAVFKTIFKAQVPLTVRDLWVSLFGILFSPSEIKKYEIFFSVFEKEGALSSRITEAAGENPTHEKIVSVYKQLAKCLQENRIFSAGYNNERNCV